jgi:hypothetical protein
MNADFYGLPTRVIENAYIRVEFLANAGPRIVRLFLRASNENWLSEAPQKKVSTLLGDYFFRGGHRLWYAPEKTPQTYQPDNAYIVVEEITDGVRLCQFPESTTGVRKSIEICLHSNRAALTLTHCIENTGLQSIVLAPWAITMLKLGGVAILPQTIRAVDAHGLLPNRNLILWQYTRINDSRLALADDFIRVHARAQLPPCKIGYLNRAGWVAYWRDEILFVKRFTAHADQPHLDFNCNAEVYCNDEFIELETLAPIRQLKPHETVEHIETWEFHTGIHSIEHIQELMK